MEKNVTREKRLAHPDHPPARCPLNPQPGMKNLQIQILPQIRGDDMLMLGLRPRTIPSWRFDVHLEVEMMLIKFVAPFHAALRRIHPVLEK
jgi:hypothetical protein